MRNFTMAQRGLDRDSYPMKLFEKAKVFGVWNPSEFDLAQDIQDWHTLTAIPKAIPTASPCRAAEARAPRKTSWGRPGRPLSLHSWSQHSGRSAAW